MAAKEQVSGSDKVCHYELRVPLCIKFAIGDERLAHVRTGTPQILRDGEQRYKVPSVQRASVHIPCAVSQERRSGVLGCLAVRACPARLPLLYFPLRTPHAAAIIVSEPLVVCQSALPMVERGGFVSVMGQLVRTASILLRVQVLPAAGICTYWGMPSCKSKSR